MILKVLHYPHPLLTKKCNLIVNFKEEELNSIINDMIETMNFKQAIGLAANQVGIDKSIFVMKVNNKTRYFINPRITTIIEKNKISFKEGCLSFPYLSQEVERFPKIELTYQDVLGEEKIEIFEDLEAICVQHELDHLNGKTFIDYLKPLKKQMTLKKYLKNLKNNKENDNI